MHAPRHRAVMHGAAAGLVAVVLPRHWIGARIGVGPPGDRLALGVWAQVEPLEITQLVMRIEVRCLEARAALQADHLHAGLAELGRDNAAYGAGANDDDVSLLGCHGSCLSRRALG